MSRKRNTALSITAHDPENHKRKRFKKNFVISSSEDNEDQNANEDEDSENEEDEWDIKCILDESETHYLIDWEGPWTPTWEPKENANDVAISVWETKKSRKLNQKEKKGNKSKGRLNQSPEIHTVSSVPTPSQHSQSRSSCPERADRKTTPEVPESAGNFESSPLFVPEDDISTEEDLPLVHRQGPSSGRGVPLSTPSTQQPQRHSVFEHIQTSSISQELLLIGELQSTPLDIAQDDVPGSAPTTSKASNISPSKDPSVSVANRSPDIKRNIAAAIDAGSENKDSNIPATQEVVIAETPPASLINSESELPRLQTQDPQPDKEPEIANSTSVTWTVSHTTQFTQSSKGLGTQIYSQPVDIQSNYSSQVSQGSCQNGYLFYTTFTAAESIVSSQHSSHSGGSTQSDFPSPLIPKTDTPELERERETKSLQSAMEKYSYIEGETPREKMRNAYAQFRSKSLGPFSPNPESSATPSSSGDIQSSLPPSVPETAPLSVRTDKGSFHHSSQTFEESELQTQIEKPENPAVLTIQPSALSFNATPEVSPGSVHLGPSEYAIPLPMDSRVKDDYERILEDKAEAIKDFIQASNTPINEYDNRVKNVQEGLEQLSNVATHPDLNISEHINDSGSDLTKEAAWAEYSSAKFLFLGYLVQYGRDQDFHLSIMVQGGKTQKIVERFLLGKGLSYTRPRHEMGDGTSVEVSLSKGSLSFGIQSTQSDRIVETYKRPSAIIALDRSFDAKSPSVEHMRTTYARDGALLPVVRLLVSNTSEHVERCFLGMPTLEGLRLVIQYTIRLRDVVGDLQDNALGVSEDVEEFLSCLQSDGFHHHWTLPMIEPLQLYSPEELDAAVNRCAQSSTSAEIGSGTATQKRSLMGDEDEQIPKRQRVVDPSQETIQATESTNFPTQTLGTDLQTLERNLAQMKATHIAEIEKFRKSLAEAESRLQDREKCLGDLQHRYEFRTKELHQVRRERDNVTQSKTSAEQRVERQKEEISRLKDERTELRHELEAAREALKSNGGNAAELENAQEEIRRLVKEQSSLERKADYEKNQAEYTREQYQNASKVAAQSSNEARTLREENETLQRKVTGDASRLREINLKNNDSRHLSRVEELELALSSREDLLRRKEDELREIRKNRPSTRSTSTQPRSPKWTAATSRPGSPGVNNNGNGNGGNGVGYAARGSVLRFSSEMSL